MVFFCHFSLFLWSWFRFHIYCRCVSTIYISTYDIPPFWRNLRIPQLKFNNMCEHPNPNWGRVGTLSEKRPVQWKPDDDDVDSGIIKVVHHFRALITIEWTSIKTAGYRMDLGSWLPSTTLQLSVNFDVEIYLTKDLTASCNIS